MFIYSHKGGLTIRSVVKPPLWESINKPVNWLVSINAYQWKSAYCYFDSSDLVNVLKYIFKMGVNRKFGLRQVWKLRWDLSNVISGGDWFFRWDFVPLCELWPCMNESQLEKKWKSYFICILLSDCTNRVVVRLN